MPDAASESPYPVLDPAHPIEALRPLCALTVMAKAPRAGRVKTRLSPPLTLEQTAALNVRFLKDTTENLAGVAGAAGVISYTPQGDEALFAGILPETFALVLQRGEGFGERLLAAAEDILAIGYGAVCLIDSDSPTVPFAAYEKAVAALKQPGDRVVIGPSADGGYYLIGLKQAHREPFERITWSTGSVLGETLTRCREAGLEVVLAADLVRRGRRRHAACAFGRIAERHAAGLRGAEADEGLRGSAYEGPAAGHAVRPCSQPNCGRPACMRVAEQTRVAVRAGHWSDFRPWQTNLALTLIGLALIGFTRQLISEGDSYTIGFSGVSSCSLALYLGAVLIFLLKPDNVDRYTFSIILFFAVACRIVTLLPDPFLSSDVYRYAWDGVVQHAGINPYRYVPGDIALKFLRAPNGDLFANINRRDYAHTIYPPAAQIFFYLVTFLNDSVTMMKLAMVLVEGVTMTGLVLLLRELGVRREWTLVYAWSPLLIWEIGGSGHVDSLIMAFVVLALLFRYRQQPVLTGLFWASRC